MGLDVPVDLNLNVGSWSSAYAAPVGSYGVVGSVGGVVLVLGAACRLYTVSVDSQSVAVE